MSKFGPSRAEYRFRLTVSLAGVAALIAILALRGLPSGPALVEVVVFGGAFFGGSAVWSAWKLWTMPKG